MKKSSIVLVIVIVFVLAVAGYFWWSSMLSHQSSTAAPQTSTSPSSPSSPTNPSTNPKGSHPVSVTAALTLNNSGGGPFGAYLSAANGMTLYQSIKDTDNVSNCTGACAVAWPPYTVSAANAASLTANPGIAGKIATIKRADGSLQVTYRGLPLYFFAQDMKPGDTKGEAVNGFTQVAP